MIGPKTNPAVSVHIAAARRAAQAALAESSAASNVGIVKTLAGSGRTQFAARGVQNARAFYATHKRSVLLGVAVAIAATLAVRMAGVRAPFLQRSQVGEQAVNTAKLDAPKGKPAEVAEAGQTGRRNDRRRPDRFDRPAAGQAGRAGPCAGERAIGERTHCGDSARDSPVLARRGRGRRAQCAIRTRDAPVRRQGAVEGSGGGGPMVRTRRVARARAGAISPRLDVREGNWRAGRSGRREALVSQGGRGRERARRAQSCGR